MRCLGEVVERSAPALCLLARVLSALRFLVGEVFGVLSLPGCVALGFWLGGSLRSGLSERAGKGSRRLQSAPGGLIRMSAGQRGHTRCLRVSAGRAHPHGCRAGPGGASGCPHQMSAGQRQAGLFRCLRHRLRTRRSRAEWSSSGAGSLAVQSPEPPCSRPVRSGTRLHPGLLG
jgi:hypothetical protein